MKIKTKRILIFIALLILVAGGLILLFRGRIIRHFIPAVKQTGNVFIVVKNDTSYVHSKILVDNNSFLEIRIDSMRYSVTLFDSTYLEDRILIGKKFSAHAQDTIDFAFKVPYSAILKDLKTERSKGDSADYSFAISIQYSTLFGKGEFLINKAAKIEIPVPPELEIVEINYGKPDLKSMQADVKVRITNNSPVTLEINELVYAMTILKTGNIKGSYGQTIKIKPNASTFVSIPIKIDAMNMGRTLFDILLNRDKYEYTLTLNAALETTDPLEQVFQIDLTRSGEMELKK